MVLKFRNIFLLLIVTTPLPAQQLLIPLNRSFTLGWEAHMMQHDSISIHTGFKPIIEQGEQLLSSVVFSNSSWNEKHFSYLLADRTWIKRKLRYESLFGVRDKDFMMEINPLMQFELGRDVGRNDAINMYKNTRGVQVNGHITDKFSFSTSFYENQWRVQTYLMAKALDIGPERFTPLGYKTEKGYGNFYGQGRAKPFGTDGFDFAMATGYVSFQAMKCLHIAAGNDKLFIGHGYRSMLLSDNSFSYPYVKTDLSLWKGKVHYSVTYAALQSLRRLKAFNTPEGIFERKTGVFHYLSWLPGKHTEIGLFESSMLVRMKNNSVTPFDYSYLNPVMGVNTIRFGLDSTQNTMLGLNFMHRLNNHIKLYGQVALDGTGPVKIAGQAGVKWFNAFGLDNMHMQLEYNVASRYTYTDPSRLQGYWHYNLPLAHPWGGGFQEWVGFVNYRFFNDYFFESRVNYGNYKLINGKEWGKNLLLDYSAIPNTTSVAFVQNIYVDLKLGYLVNPITNLRMMVGFTSYYQFVDRGRYNSNYLYVGMSTSLTNLYLDI